MSSQHHSLLEKIERGAATVGVIGLGYVGIPLALRCADVGLPVIGFDVLPERVDQLNTARSPIKHISDESIRRMRDAGFRATTDFAEIEKCDVIIICVPTPLKSGREPDLGFVTATMESIQPYLRAGQMLSLESTTWPGTTDEVLAPYVSCAGLNAGETFFLVYSPEREDPGNPAYSTRTIPKVVGGYTPACLDCGEAFYGLVVDRVVPVSSTRAAELVKLLENIHRSVNIGLVNEMKIICDAMGLDVFEVVDAAATKPFGFTPYYPGPGVGGHCIPIDPFYLTWKAREFGLHTRFIELAGEVNAAMPQYVLDKTIAALNERGKALRGSRVLVLGVSYKKDVDDTRESPSVHVMELLRKWGAEVAYSDPYVPVFPRMREHAFDLRSVELTPEALSAFDAVLLLTNHSDFDYGMIREHAPVLVDTRGKYRDGGGNIYRA